MSMTQRISQRGDQDDQEGLAMVQQRPRDFGQPIGKSKSL
jgi:hypothetical protein